MFIIFTGNGKGKTTAALGQALRAAGHNKRTLFVQFIKGPWHSGEEESVKKIAPNIVIVKKGLGFVGILGDKYPITEHKKAAQNGIAFAKQCAMGGGWNIVILDELWNALELGLVSCEDIRVCLREIFPIVEHIIVTGRDCPTEFIEMADIVTEMREIKHVFKAGAMAKSSIEF